MKRIAFVVQRYGTEVNGGAELHCRQFAERMAKYYEVEAITTKAVDYVTWADAYEADTETLNGVLVRRFSVDEPRDIEAFNRLSQTVMQFHASKEEEEEWMRKQGPYSTSLLRYLAEHKDEYDVFIFFTYLYATTYFGLPIVKEKAMIIPTAHDELPIYLGIFKDLFLMPRAYFYNTAIEQAFVEKKFGCSHILNNGGAGGVGVDVPAAISAERFREKYGLDDFILYIGRIDEHKGCKELFQYFMQYKKRNPGSLKLVLAGKEVIPIPESEDIVSLGFVTDRDKFDVLAACKLLVLPSQFESLSMVVLEAMAVKRPVVIHGNCEVVRQHCVKSNGGLYYRNYFEFEGCLNYLLEREELCQKMGENGKQYVDENYCWDAIENRLKNMIEEVGDLHEHEENN